MQSRARFNVAQSIPQRAGTLRVVTTMGRGNVSVIQQPTAINGYDAVIQIVDNDGGADNYRVTAYWTPVDDGFNDRGRRGRGNDRNNNGIKDKLENRDNRNDRIIATSESVATTSRSFSGRVTWFDARWQQ